VVTEKEDGIVLERPKYKLYDLRHFYASMLIDQRINLKRIQTLMGHRSIQTTLSPYPARAGCATAVGRRRTRLAPPGRVPVFS
jgi:integrase